MTKEQELEFWIDFVSKNEEKETTDDEITFYDFKRIFEHYYGSLDSEYNKLANSLKFPFEVENVKIEIEKEDDDEECYEIKITYNSKENGYTIDSYNIDRLGTYYTGYYLNQKQVSDFYQANSEFFKRIVPLNYLKIFTPSFNFDYSYEDGGITLDISSMHVFIYYTGEKLIKIFIMIVKQFFLIII